MFLPRYIVVNGQDENCAEDEDFLIFKRFSPSSKRIVVKSLQSAKTDSPMDVTLFGIVTEVKPLQPEKA